MAPNLTDSLLQMPPGAVVIALLQRVSAAEVRVAGRVVGAIGQGVLAFIGIRRADDTHSAERLLARTLDYRLFADEQDRMNLSVRQVHGGLLLVPQFTLAADTSNGTRAGFSTAAAPAEARRLFEHLLERAHALHQPVAAGVFAADMQVSLVNDGPVTFWLESPPATAPNS